MEKDIFVTSPFLPEKEVFLQYVDRIWDSRWLTNQGPLHEQFRGELKSYLEAPYVTLVVNGHMALEIAIRGLGVKGEVITTPFTFAIGFSRLSASEFFVFRKTEACETKNHLLCGWCNKCL